MDVNVLGRIKNTKLPDRHALMPLFEAVVNSIDAIQERGTSGKIEVVIIRDPQQSLETLHWKAIPDVFGFEIRDNGIGFTDSNFKSFNTIDSPAKEARGGKGIGRILWLKAFDRVEVSSIYLEQDRHFIREFTFLPTPDGVEGENNIPIDEFLDDPSSGTSVGTTVRLIGFKKRYRQCCPKSPEVIARRIVEHCLEYYLLDEAPEITVGEQDSEAVVSLTELYRREYRPQSEPREFRLGEHVFSITDIYLRGTRDPSHQLFFCARKRAVRSLKLVGIIPHLDETLTNKEGQFVTYAGYVRSPFLEARVDADRFDFDIDQRGELALNQGIVWEDIEEQAIGVAEEFLQPAMVEAKARAWSRIEAFIQDEAPKYRPLLTHRREALTRLPHSLSAEKLDAELHRIQSDWQFEVRRAAAGKLREKVDSPLKFSAYRQQYAHLLDELADIAKSELAEYVVHRRLILSFFQKLLGLQSTSKFALESAVHDVIFPLRRTSDDVEYIDHNLWIVDERLAYHHYLASDIPFNGQQNAPVKVNGSQRPDILIFNRPIAFAQGDAPFSSVVVIEFKRPERDDYSGDENPIRQVLKYVQQLRSGQAKRADGSTVNLPAGTAFYCYIIATITQGLREEADINSFKAMPDGDGFFTYNENYNAYVEILSFHKVLNDAKKRNQIFFDKLHMPLHKPLPPAKGSSEINSDPQETPEVEQNGSRLAGT